MTYRFQKRRGIGGRPALRAEQLRSVRLEARLTEKEALCVKARAEDAGLSVSDYLRHRALATESGEMKTE